MESYQKQTKTGGKLTTLQPKKEQAPIDVAQSGCTSSKKSLSLLV